MFLFQICSLWKLKQNCRMSLRSSVRTGGLVPQLLGALSADDLQLSSELDRGTPPGSCPLSSHHLLTGQWKEEHKARLHCCPNLGQACRASPALVPSMGLAKASLGTASELNLSLCSMSYFFFSYYSGWSQEHAWKTFYPLISISESVS
jgi:hypothetical protein